MMLKNKIAKSCRDAILIGAGLASMSCLNSCSHSRKESFLSYNINSRESLYSKDNSFEKALKNIRKDSLKEMKRIVLSSNFYNYNGSGEININKDKFPSHVSWTLLDRINTDKLIFVESVGNDHYSANRNSGMNAEVIQIMFLKKRDDKMQKCDFYLSMDLDKDGVITEREFDKRLSYMGYAGYNFKGSSASLVNELELIRKDGIIEKSVLYK